MQGQNYLDLEGIEFVEFSSPDSPWLEKLFLAFGFSKTKKHRSLAIDYFCQNDIHFFVNKEKDSFADSFAKEHGASICSMGWRVKNAKKAWETALQRGAKPAETSDYRDAQGKPIPAIMGIGNSLIYFIDDYANGAVYDRMGFVNLTNPIVTQEKGFLVIDHLTNNVVKGTMKEWADFYKNVFGFTEVRYFDIRGAKTGLTSFALRSPDGSFCIPINEGNEEKSQINEYLREYKGPGVQHLAFLTRDILASLKSLEGSPISMLDMDSAYYDEAFKRVPQVSEDREQLKKYNILVDGDEEGYLLQIFTKNIIGPIFIEIIQRKNHLAFGEGNFGALFRSIERDQQKRGVL